MSFLIDLSRRAVRTIVLGLMTPQVRARQEFRTSETGRLFFANHLSVADFALLWASLPKVERRKTRIIGAADYWTQNPIRRFLAQDVFNALLVHRPNDDQNIAESQTQNSLCLRQMANALKSGENLILFPEGTRGSNPHTLLPFQPGLFALARLVRNLDLVPVWLGNLNQSLPKGQKVPLPLICQVQFGEPIRLDKNEPISQFNARAQSALLQTSAMGT